MQLKLFNTLTRQKETFQPLVPGKASLYVCGPTVYDRIHLGNARPIVVFDTLYRLLSLEYHTTYVRNITDVDDKINARARERGCPIDTLTAETTEFFHHDIKALNTLPPTHEPRATHHIKEMITMIERLLAQGQAYEAEKHVLFKVSSLPSYGSLSRQDREGILAGARVEVAPYKQDPSDFVLWKPSEPGIPAWESPWGLGRPGWHIECSAMSCRYLGETFDIHGGGQDLIFPHHENERAQSVATYGEESFARYWVHNGLLTVNGTKMSKSLGNFVTLAEALNLYHPEIIRFLFASTHYRQGLDWNDQAVQQAKNALDSLYTALEGGAFKENPSKENSKLIDPLVLEALCDDLNMPLALTRLHESASQIHKLSEGAEKAEKQAVLRSSGQFLGIFYQDAQAWFQWQPPQAQGLSEQEIESFIAQRLQARARKDYQEADRIRHHLEAQGILLKDTSDGTQWRRQR